MCIAVRSCAWVHVLTCCSTHMEVRGQSRGCSSLLPCPVQSLPPTLPSAYTRLLGSGPSGFSCLCLPITVGDWCHRQAVTGFTRLLGMWTQVLVFIWQAHTTLSHDPSPFHFEASSTRLILHPCYTFYNVPPPPWFRPWKVWSGDIQLVLNVSSWLLLREHSGPASLCITIHCFLTSVFFLSCISFPSDSICVLKMLAILLLKTEYFVGLYSQSFSSKFHHSGIFLWAASSQITTWWFVINNESSALA